MSRRLAVFSLMNPRPYETDLSREPDRDDVAYRVHALLRAHLSVNLEVDYPERGLGFAIDEQAVRDLSEEAMGTDYSREFGDALIVPLLAEYGLYEDWHRITRHEQWMAFGATSSEADEAALSAAGSTVASAGPSA